MTLGTWLLENTKLLEDAGIATARLDALVLLCDATGKDKSYILAHADEVLEPKITQALEKHLARRAKHEPLAYIRGKSEFYGRKLLINEHTLEPRPETETMIDCFKELDITEGSVADIGTGSGCIAISIKLEFPKLLVVATDIDEKCLKTAKKNARNLSADVTYVQGNLLEPLPSVPDVSLCNLPYVPDKYELNSAAKFEPKNAIFGGADGLDFYRKLFLQIATLLQYDSQKPRFVLTESLPFQHEELAKIAENSSYKLIKTDDFIQVFTYSSR